MQSGALREDDEETIRGVVDLMMRAVRGDDWVWTEKDTSFALRAIRESFGEGRISRVATVKEVGVIGWLTAYETMGKLWKPLVCVYDKHYKEIGKISIKELLHTDMECFVRSIGGITAGNFYRTTRKTDLTAKFSRN